MSNILSDPLFVNAEVDYRLERFGPRAAASRSWPSPSRRLRRWISARRLARRSGDHRPVLVASRPRHP